MKKNISHTLYFPKYFPKETCRTCNGAVQQFSILLQNTHLFVFFFYNVDSALLFLCSIYFLYFYIFTLTHSFIHWPSSTRSSYRSPLCWVHPGRAASWLYETNFLKGLILTSVHLLHMSNHITSHNSPTYIHKHPVNA